MFLVRFVLLFTTFSIFSVGAGAAEENIAIAIATGTDHSLILRKDGSVLGMGSNAFGQLGLRAEGAPFGDSKNMNYLVPTPVPISETFGKKVTGLAGGFMASLFLLENGNVVSAGPPYSVGSTGPAWLPYLIQLPKDLRPDTRISAGETSFFYAFFLASDGTVFRNRVKSEEPDLVPIIFPASVASKPGQMVSDRVIAISIGMGFHAFFLFEDGRVFESAGTMRDDNHKGLAFPTAIDLAGLNSKVIAIRAGGNGCFFILEDGSVYDFRHPEGLTRIKYPNEGKIRVAAISASALDGSLFLLENGEVYAVNEDPRKADFKRIEFPNYAKGKAIAVSSGGYHSLFLFDSGQLFGLGLNDTGQLGLGNKVLVTNPELIPY